jgi:hypothetical protein
LSGHPERRVRVYPRAASASKAELVREYELREPNSLQLARLASLAGVPAASLENKSIAALKDELVINPILFDFELVCGQVVKVDPGTGAKFPVAGATVNVYDLDCDWLWFFPEGWPWSWGFRLPWCVSELVGSVPTDACGNFCILIPRWDIEWIREWILERWCFPEILQRPSVANLLLPHLPGGPATTSSGRPDPSSLVRLLDARDDLAAAIGPAAVQAIRDAARSHQVGSPATGLSQVLAANAFTRPVPAPVPAELRALAPADALRSLSSRLSLRQAEGELDLSAGYGPFLRCIDVDVPIWVPFFSVPEISFQVTQEIGGTEQVIYDGAFETSWDAYPLPVNVELDVAQFAIASPFPGCPGDIACEDAPAIVQIGYLDVNPDYLNPATGFAVRMNEDSSSDVPSTAPFQGTLPLFGCAPDAEFYRVQATFAAGDGLSTPTSFGPPQPVIGPAWQVSRIVGGVTELSPPIVPTADGWYPTGYLSWDPQNLLVNWAPIDGVYQLTVQAGNSGSSGIEVVATSDPILLVVDSTRPTLGPFTPVSWNYVGESPTPFTVDDGCYIIERTSQDIEITLSYSVTAGHLYSVDLVPDGCDVASVTVVDSGALLPDSPGSNDLSYLYDGPADNSLTGTVTYKIAAGALDGCYTWLLTAFSRAFSPNDSNGLTDVGGYAWNYAQTWVWSDALTSVGVITLAPGGSSGP